MIGVYCYTNFDEILYVGKSKNIKHRYIEHKSDCSNKKSKAYNYPFYKYIREHNISCEELNFVILKEFEIYDETESKSAERYYI